jgi:hypothetical protein
MATQLTKNGNTLHVVSLKGSNDCVVMASYNIGNNSAALSCIYYMNQYTGSEYNDAFYYSILFKAFRDYIDMGFNSKPSIVAKNGISLSGFTLGAGRGHISVKCKKVGAAVKQALKYLTKLPAASKVAKIAYEWAKSRNVALDKGMLKSAAEKLVESLPRMDVLIIGVKDASKVDLAKFGDKNIFALGESAPKHGGSTIGGRTGLDLTTIKCDSALKLYVKWGFLKSKTSMPVCAETNKLVLNEKLESINAAFKSSTAAASVNNIMPLLASRGTEALVYNAATSAIGDVTKLFAESKHKLDKAAVEKFFD